jgi:hypothetical protein
MSAVTEISSVSQSGSGSGSESDAPPAVSSLDSQQCATMHDLRKKIRGQDCPRVLAGSAGGDAVVIRRASHCLLPE